MPPGAAIVSRRPDACSLQAFAAQTDRLDDLLGARPLHAAVGEEAPCCAPSRMRSTGGSRGLRGGSGAPVRRRRSWRARIAKLAAVADTTAARCSRDWDSCACRVASTVSRTFSFSIGRSALTRARGGRRAAGCSPGCPNRARPCRSGRPWASNALLSVSDGVHVSAAALVHGHRVVVVDAAAEFTERIGR